MTASTRTPRVSLDLEQMTDMQLVRELGRLHFELNTRLHDHWVYGANPDGREQSGHEADPARLDQALLLGARLDEMTRQFREGPIVAPADREDDGDWHVGIDSCNELIREWTTRLDQQAEAVAS